MPLRLVQELFYELREPVRISEFVFDMRQNGADVQDILLRTAAQKDGKLGDAEVFPRVHADASFQKIEERPLLLKCEAVRDEVDFNAHDPEREKILVPIHRLEAVPLSQFFSEHGGDGGEESASTAERELRRGDEQIKVFRIPVPQIERRETGPAGEKHTAFRDGGDVAKETCQYYTFFRRSPASFKTNAGLNVSGNPAAWRHSVFLLSLIAPQRRSFSRKSRTSSHVKNSIVS